MALELDGRYNKTKILDYSSKIIANAEKLQTLDLYSKIRRLRQESQRKSKIIIYDVGCFHTMKHIFLKGYTFVEIMQKAEFLSNAIFTTRRAHSLVPPKRY